MSTVELNRSPTVPWDSTDQTAGIATQKNTGGETVEATETIPSRAKWLMVGCSSVAIAASAYLAWSSLTSSPLAGCDSGSVFDCSHVLHSRWSNVLSVPVSIPAIMLHATVIGMLLWRPKTTDGNRFRLFAVTLLTLTAGAAALWFIGLQVFWLKHLCQYCLVAHTAALVLVATAIWVRPAGPSVILRSMVGASILIAALIALQTTAQEPQHYEVIEYGTAPANMSSDSQTTEPLEDDAMLFEAPISMSPVPRTRRSNSQGGWSDWNLAMISLVNPSLMLQSAVAAEDVSAEDRASKTDTREPQASEVRILGGTRLDAASWPMIGDPNAELIFVELFDYTCPHCQRTHVSLKGAQRHFGDRMSVITLPVPLNRQCNSAVKSTGSGHREACEIAKLAIAVWLTDRAQFEAFHNYLFDTKPTYSRALGKARAMVNEVELDKSLRSDLPEKYIQKHVALYRRAGAGIIPKLMFANNTSVGAVESTDAMIRLIQRYAK